MQNTILALLSKVMEGRCITNFGLLNYGIIKYDEYMYKVLNFVMFNLNICYLFSLFLHYLRKIVVYNAYLYSPESY